MCVCVCAGCVRVSRHMCVCLCMCRAVIHVLCLQPLQLIVEKSLSLKVELAHQTDWSISPGDFLPLPPKAWDCNCMPQSWLTLVNVSQFRVPWELEELSPSDCPVGVSVGHFPGY